MKRFFVATILFVPAVGAQIIDFETLPDGSPTTDQQEICDEYAALGVTFSLLDHTTGEPIGCPLTAKTGDPKNAFSGCTASDLPLPGQGTGTTMLTDGMSLGIDGDLLVTYTIPVSQCSGIILDADCRVNGLAPCEQWTITARDAGGATLATHVIDAPPGPSNPACLDANAGPGDSVAFNWSFDLPGQAIASVLIRYTGDAQNVGLAFDNFSPFDVPPLSVTARGPRAEICLGHNVELYADVRGGFPPYTYQWQLETSPGTWTDLGAAPSEIVGPTATTTYRVQVGDTDGGMAESVFTVEVVSGTGHFVCDARLLVSSFHTDRVLRYDPVTLSFVDAFVAAGSGGLDGASDLDFLHDGSLVVSSQNNNQLLQFDGSSGAFLGVLVASGANGPNVPVGLAVGSDGHIYMANVGNNRVRRYDGSTGAYIDDFVAVGSGGLSEPTGITFGDDGHLYVSSRLTNSIKRYDGAAGTYIDDFVAAAAGGLADPRGLTFHPHPDGDLYVGTQNGDDVQRYDGATGIPKGPFVTAGLGTLDRGNDVVFGPEGNLYVASFDNDKVLVYGEQTGIFIGAFPTGNGLDGAAWLQFTLFCGDGTCASERGETPCSCVADCGDPAGAETVCDDGIDQDCDGAVDCADADCAAEMSCAGSGSVPVDAQVPGTALLLGRGAGDALELTWGASCAVADTDFAVYEGLLPLPGSHTPVTCSTGGAAAWTVETPGDGSRYYLVVPRSAVSEGSYGRTSSAAERPQGAFPCLPQNITCP